MQIKQGFQENYHITQFLPIKIKNKKQLSYQSISESNKRAII